MTPIDRFERGLPAALADLADERTPDYLIDILGRTARTRQRSAWTHPGRWLTMTGPTIRPAFVALVAAVLVVVIGGGLLLSRSNDNGVGGPTTVPSSVPLASPSAAQTPAASPTGSAQALIPEALRTKWIAPSRDVVGLTPRAAFRIIFGPSSFSFPTGSTSPGALASDASVIGPDRIRLVSLRTESGCQTGDAGIYSWTLSTTGSLLSLSGISDSCASRAAALPGDWTRIKCTDPSDDCYGVLAAGTYQSQFIDPRIDPGANWSARYGAIEFTVPDGWANSGDWPETFDLTTADVYALETPQGPPADIRHGVSIVTQPAAVVPTADCTDQLAPTVHRTVGALIDWLRAQPSVVVSAPTNVTIDGHHGQQVDVTLAPTWTGTCGSATPAASILGYARGGPDDWSWGIVAGEHQRLTLLDLGGGDVVMIAIDSTYPDRWADLLAQATPIVHSLHFK
jgi:hypothetical protein